MMELLDEATVRVRFHKATKIRDVALFMQTSMHYFT